VDCDAGLMLKRKRAIAQDAGESCPNPGAFDIYLGAAPAGSKVQVLSFLFLAR
jgi:hypothetical protein